MSRLGERWARARGTEDFAWACLLTNVVGVPGLGTLMAQRWEGVPQLALAIAGGVLITWWLVAFVIAELRTMEIPPPGRPRPGSRPLGPRPLHGRVAVVPGLEPGRLPGRRGRPSAAARRRSHAT